VKRKEKNTQKVRRSKYKAGLAIKIDNDVDALTACQDQLFCAPKCPSSEFLAGFLPGLGQNFSQSHLDRLNICVHMQEKINSFNIVFSAQNWPASTCSN